MVNPIPYRVDCFSHKIHYDQNKKLVMYGATHVIAIDGHSRFIVDYSTMPIKSNVLICDDIYRFTPSQADAVVFQALSSAPDSSHAHILRWYKHLQSYSTQDRDGFKGQKKAITEYGPRGNEQAGKADDDFDLFDDDDDDEEEEETEEQKKVKEERLAAYYAKKSKKPTVVAKSSLLLDVKPWDDETDVKKMEECVRSIKADGLLWGQAKYIPIAYGIKKLQINCVIEDDKISTDFLEEEITKFEDYVQSMDIAAFNKI